MSVIRKEQTNIAGGGGARYDADMTAAYESWAVNHGLGTLHPVVTCTDEFGRVLVPWNIRVVDNMNIVIQFWNHYNKTYTRSAPAGHVVVM